MSEYVVEIDQSAIAAPDFPRTAEWWRGFLPIWVSNRSWWTQPREERDLSNARVYVERDVVSVAAEDRTHAVEIVGWLRGSALKKFVADPESSVRLVKRD